MITQTKTNREGLETRVAKVGHVLTDRLGEVVHSVPGSSPRPQEFARALSLKKDFSSRLLAALRQNNELAALHIMPGPVPLRDFLRSASDAGVPMQLIEEAGQAIDTFDELVREEFGSRADLDALLSSVVPEARDRFEGNAKQAIYRGAAGIRGVMCEVGFALFLVHPSGPEHPGRCDTSVVLGHLGLRRTRPGVPFEFALLARSRNPDAPTPTAPPLLEEHCTPAELPIRVVDEGERIRYLLDESSVGRKDEANIVAADRVIANQPRFANDDEDTTRWFYATVNPPMTMLVQDVLVHRDVWNQAPAKLDIYDRTQGDPLSNDEHVRNNVRLDLDERIDDLRNMTGPHRCPNIPRYTDIIRDLCDNYGWDPSAFRTVRTTIRYPFYGSQSVISLDISNCSKPE